MINIKAHIPNTITCLNLISGTIACILALHGPEPLGALTGWQWAFIAIAAAAVFDFADGATARLLKAYSDLGKQLDSLSDLVSFGLAPTLLMYSVMRSADISPIWWVFPLLIVVCGALRLGKFNIDTRQTTSFIGLPIPANAIFWIGVVSWISTYGCPSGWVLALIILFESTLMVSSMRMFSLKFANFGWRENFRRYVIILAAILFVATNGLPGLAWTTLLYILISAVGRKE